MLRFAGAVTGRASTMWDDIEACPPRLGKSSAFHPEFLGFIPRRLLCTDRGGPAPGLERLSFKAGLWSADALSSPIAGPWRSTHRLQRGNSPRSSQPILPVTAR